MKAGGNAGEEMPVMCLGELVCCVDHHIAPVCCVDMEDQSHGRKERL